MSMNSCQRILEKCGWAALGLLVWGFAVSSIWSVSTLGGGDLGRGPEYVAGQVALSMPLRPFCRNLAVDLAEAETRAKATARRPTGRIFAERRDEVVDLWFDAGCPAAVLPGIAFGAAEAARAVTGRS
jgi:hypothetical protein